MMRLFDEGGFQMGLANHLAEQARNAVESMELGYTTPENITWEDREAIREYMRHMPLKYKDPNTGLSEVYGEKNLIEGQDWAFVTRLLPGLDEWVMGLVLLNSPHQVDTSGMVFWLWPGDYNYPGYDGDLPDVVSHDSLGTYQTAALDYLVAAERKSSEDDVLPAAA